MNLKKLIALLLAALMLFGALTACAKQDSDETEAPSGAETDATGATEATEPADPTEPSDAPIDETGVTILDNYAVTEAAPHDENMSAVIAVNADGSPAMNNSTLQFIYWLSFFNFMNYNSYAAYFVDPSVPLAEQLSWEEPYTWEQLFLKEATEEYREQYALYRAALDSGYVLPEEDQAYLDDVLDPNGSIATGAAEAGFDSAEAYLQDNFGPGVDLQDYYDYVNVYLTANSYYTAIMAPLEEAFEADGETALRAFYDEHAAYFATTPIRIVNNVSVRHILISPEQDETTGAISDEAWAAAERTANELLAQWQQNPTEDNFAALANDNSSDPGSNTTGGLYEDFDSSTMVAEFTDWSFDPARVYGDTGIVKTTYGYHIMFFIGQTETKGWVEAVHSKMPDAILFELCDAYPVTFDFTRVRIFDLVTLMANEDAEAASEETPAP